MIRNRRRSIRSGHMLPVIMLTCLGWSLAEETRVPLETTVPQQVLVGTPHDVLIQLFPHLPPPEELPQLLEADTQVYGRVMETYRMPRKTDEQKQAREAAMQQALQEAAIVPLTIAERCARIVDLALPAAELGNQWAVSDAGVGVLLAEACMHSALLNVYINLSSIKDEAFVAQTKARIDEITAGKGEIKERVMGLVHDKIGA